MPAGGIAAMIRGSIVALLVAGPVCAPRAAELAGVTLPDSRVVDGTRLILNGIGLRTYSFLGIKIYVAGLYLPQRSSNAEAILHAREPKVLDIHFLRDVDAEAAHKSWRNGFANNCRPPDCSVDQRDVEQFISRVPAVHDGDESTMVFTSKGVRVSFNGQLMGDITDNHFAEVLLRTFLGPEPPTPRLKRELLGQE
jgi:hypothetical protein